MRDKLLKEASTGLDSDEKQSNVLLYIIGAVVILVVLGGQGILFWDLGCFCLYLVLQLWLIGSAACRAENIYWIENMFKWNNFQGFLL